jgi:hypothetical protein
VILDHVTNAAISGLTVEGNVNAESTLRFIATEQVLLTAPRVLKQAQAFLQLEGMGNNGIIVDGGDLSRAKEALVLKDGAEKTAIRLRGN